MKWHEVVIHKNIFRDCVKHLAIQNPIILHGNARSHTAAVTDLLRRWQWEILEHLPYPPDMNPCDCDLFAEVKEPLRGTRYNTRDELICAIWRSTRIINKGGRADGIRRLPNIWQKVINKRATILKVHKCCTSVNKTYPCYRAVNMEHQQRWSC